MTVGEFKAWFEGFCEAIDGTPTVAQWNRIRDKIEKLKDDPLKGLGAIPHPSAPRFYANLPSSL